MSRSGQYLVLWLTQLCLLPALPTCMPAARYSPRGAQTPAMLAWGPLALKQAHVSPLSVVDNQHLCQLSALCSRNC